MTVRTHILAPTAQRSQKFRQILEHIQLDSIAAHSPDNVCWLLWVDGMTEQRPSQKHWSMMWDISQLQQLTVHFLHRDKSKTSEILWKQLMLSKHVADCTLLLTLSFLLQIIISNIQLSKLHGCSLALFLCVVYWLTAVLTSDVLCPKSLMLKIYCFTPFSWPTSLHTPLFRERPKIIKQT